MLTTLQCNFACDYCLQGDHGDYNKSAAKMSMATAARVADWIEARLDALGRRVRADVLRRRAAAQPAGVYYLSERMWHACEARGVEMFSTSSPTACC